MPRMKLLLDTNIVVDFLNVREPFYEKARLLMIAGKAGEFSLWVSASQMTDLVYILSDGGKPRLAPQALEQLRGLRTFVNVYSLSEDDVDVMLTTIWSDPEDALLHQVALQLAADAIITRDKELFENSLIKVYDCDEFFAWMEDELGVSYCEFEV